MFELLNLLCSLFEPLSVVFYPLLDSGGEPVGYGVDGGVECWVKGKDCLS